MTYAYRGTLGTKPGKRDEVVALLTRRSTELADAGCLLYEVGVNDEPGSVYVSELWESAEAHHASLQLDSVRATIVEAMPLLSGDTLPSRFRRDSAYVPCLSRCQERLIRRQSVAPEGASSAADGGSKAPE